MLGYSLNTIKGVRNDLQVLQFWAAASVWRCALLRLALHRRLLRLSHLLSACWAPFQSGRERWTDSLGVSSPQDCQKSSVKSPSWLAMQALRKLTRSRERLRRDSALYVATQLLYLKKKKKTPSDLCQWSFYTVGGSIEVQNNEFFLWLSSNRSLDYLSQNKKYI